MEYTNVSQINNILSQKKFVFSKKKNVHKNLISSIELENSGSISLIDSSDGDKARLKKNYAIRIKIIQVLKQQEMI